MDVRDNPRLLDVVVTPSGGGGPVNVTENGFRHFLSNYVNGSGQTTILSGVVGGEVQLSDRLRADLGLRVEYDDYVQSAENTSTFDLDLDPATTFDNETFGNNTFRHFSKSITDWSASAGLNFRLNDRVGLYATGSRGYKMPALDDFLNASVQEQVNLFESREVQSLAGGVKYGSGSIGAHGQRFLYQAEERHQPGSRVGPRHGRYPLEHPGPAGEPLVRCARGGGLRQPAGGAAADRQRNGHECGDRGGCSGYAPGFRRTFSVGEQTAEYRAELHRKHCRPVFSSSGRWAPIQGRLALRRLALQ